MVAKKSKDDAKDEPKVDKTKAPVADKDKANLHAETPASEKSSDDLDTGPDYDVWEWQVVTRSGVEGVDANPGPVSGAITEAINQGYRPTGEEPWHTGPEDHADKVSQVFTWHVPVLKAKVAPAEQPGNVPDRAPLESDFHDNDDDKNTDTKNKK